MSAARHRGEPADRGAGLPEVMVGVAIFTLLIGLLASFSINMLRTGNGVNNRVANVNDLRVAMDEISKGLRVAIRPEQVGAACPTCDIALYTATTNEVSFYASQAGAPRLTIYRVEKDTDPTAVPNTGRLVALNKPAGMVSALSGSTCDATCTRRVLVRGLTWPLTAPVFKYAIARDCSNPALFSAPAAGVPSTNTACVAVDLRAAGARDNAGIGVTSTVFMPNSLIGR